MIWSGVGPPRSKKRRGKRGRIKRREKRIIRREKRIMAWVGARRGVPRANLGFKC